MIRPIVRDIMFLSMKSEPATREDLSAGNDLLDTLKANRARCAGMAANMIGIRKRIIAVNIGFAEVVMYNPSILGREDPYETEEGCLSLDGFRPTKRYRNIEIEYRDNDWKLRRQRFFGPIAQVIQHEMDHLDGVII